VPLVSICIPTHSAQRLRYLREAVESARSQTHGDIEILISDNGSDAPIRAFAEEQMGLDPRLRYRRNEPSLSVGGNFNAALQDARGDYLLFVGDDDRLLPRCVESLLAACDQGTTAVFSNHYIIDSEGNRLEEATYRNTVTYARDRLPGGAVADPLACAWRQTMCLIGCLFRSADLQSVGLRTDIRSADFELFIRLANRGYAFAYVPAYLCEYRVHPRSLTSSGAHDEGLFDILEQIPVPSRLEPLKRDLLSRVLVDAVSGALKTGDVRRAREMMHQRYYPGLRDRNAQVLVQRALALLPPRMARSFSAVLAQMRRGVRETTGLPV
jgi:glycosyltransferase involved in cell wall biosynthesis